MPHNGLPTPTDYYTILDVDKDANEATIRTALRRLPLEAGDGTDTYERHIKLVEAYRVLSDPDKRRDYNTQTGVHRPAPDGASDSLGERNAFLRRFGSSKKMPSQAELPVDLVWGGMLSQIDAYSTRIGDGSISGT